MVWAGEIVELGAFAGGVKDGLAHLDLGFGDFGGNVHALDKAVEERGVDAIDGLADVSKVHRDPFRESLPGVGWLALGGVLEEGVPDGERRGCLGYGDGSGDDAGIVTAVDRELGIFHGVHVYGLLLAAN